MKKMQYIFIIILCLLPLALNSLANWQTLSTDKFTIYYQPGMESAAWQAITVLEYYRPSTEKLVGNSYPQAAIKLEDMGNLINGWANPLGSNIALFLYPPTSDELSMSEEWFQLVGPHEYIHQLQLTKDSHIPALIRKTFGNLFHVQYHQPPWMTEGITVYGESQLSPYSGRMNSGYYSALISSLAKAGKLPSPTKAAYYSTDTPLAHYYVFGGSFHQFLAETYGEERFSRLYADNSSRILAYANGIFPSLALDKAFENTYGKALTTLWQEWQDSEASSDFIPATENLTKDGWHKGNLQIHANKLYYTFSKTDKTTPGGGFGSNGIACLDPEKPLQAASIFHAQATEYPAGFQFSGDQLYFSRYELKRGFQNNDNDGYGYITEILALDKASGREKVLYKGNVRAFASQDDGSILVSEDDPGYRQSTLFRYFPDTKHKETLYHGDHLIHGIALHQGKIYLNAKGYWQNSSIYTLENGTLTPLIDSPTQETLLYIDGDKLYYNAVLEDETCAFEFNLDTQQIKQFGPASYINSPVLTPSGATFFISVNPMGKDVYRDTLQLSDVSLPDLKPSTPPFSYAKYQDQDAVLDKFPITKGGYSQNLLHLFRPRIAHVPQFYINGDSLALGIILAGNDAVGDFPLWQLWGLYDAHYEQFRVDFSLSNSFFRPIHQDFRYSNLDGGSFSSRQYLSLFRSVNFGFNSLDTGFGYSTQDDFARKILSPFVASGYSWQTGRMSWQNTIYYEDTDAMHSSRERLGWQSQLNFKQKTESDSELRSVLNFALDPDADIDEVFYPIRGYNDELPSAKGITMRNTWQKSVYQIRKGSWSPQVYLEDIFGALFLDAALPLPYAKDDIQFSGGLELTAEVNLLFMGAVNPGIRMGMNGDSELFFGVILGLDY